MKNLFKVIAIIFVFTSGVFAQNTKKYAPEELAKNECTVKNIITGQCEITTQNHGFGVDPEAVKNHPNVEVTHLNLNDNSVEGIRLKNKPAFSVQYHPESTPGPHDSRYLFDDFIAMIKERMN